MLKLQYLSDIDDFLENHESKKLSVSELGLIISQLQIHTGLPKETCKIILTYFFKEIQNSLFKERKIQLTNFGKLSLISNSTGHFIKFKPSKCLKRKLNEFNNYCK